MYGMSIAFSVCVSLQQYREEKEEYLRDLRTFLNHIPLAEQSFEERQLKDCLRRLETQVTNYCTSHNIDATPSSSRMVAWRSVPSGLEKDSDSCKNITPNVTRNRDNRSSTCSISPTQSTNYTDGPDVTTLTASNPASLLTTGVRENESKSVVQTRNSVVVEVVMEECDALQQGVGNIQPMSSSGQPPPPPPPPPPPVTLRLFLGGTGAANAAGTGQFVSHNTYNHQSQQSMPTSTTTTPNQTGSKVQKSFIDEIASVGQTKLRPTQRPRSPGGTPIKSLEEHATTPSANDKIQQALLNKFKTLHSTAVRPHSHQRSAVQEHVIGQSMTSDPNDFSNQWSDVNSFEDPDLTAGDITSGGGGGGGGTTDVLSSPNMSQGFNPSTSKISTPKPGKGTSTKKPKKSPWRAIKNKSGGKGHGASPNTSTAV